MLAVLMRLPRFTAGLAGGILLLAAALWATVAYGFYAVLRADRLLELGATAFFLAAVVTLAVYLRRLFQDARAGPTPSPVPVALRVLFVAAIPASILAMSMACGFPGCTPYCQALTAGAVVMTALGAREAFKGDAAPALLVASLAYAVPHCTCLNPINGGWIHRLGVSPDCFAFPLVTMVLAVVGLRGVWPRLTAVFCLGPALAAAAFGVGHQFLHYPW